MPTIDERLSNALAIIACLVDKLGGEVVVSKRDFEALKGLPLVGRDVGTHLIMRLKYEEAEHMEGFGPSFLDED